MDAQSSGGGYSAASQTSSSGGESGGGGGSPNAGAGSPILDDKITPPDQNLADLVNANYASLGPLYSTLENGPVSGTQTVLVPQRPTSTNWTPYIVLAALFGAFFYWYKHKKKEG